jgi:hypothetical protein
MAMKYGAKLSYFVEAGEEMRFVRLEVPVYAFEVDGGANRNIILSSTDDISISSELEQARSFKHLRMWIAPGENFDMRAHAELSEIAAKDMALNVLFAVERYSDGKVLEALALLDRGAEAYPPGILKNIFVVNVRVPTAKLYYGKIDGTTLKNYKEM